MADISAASEVFLWKKAEPGCSSISVSPLETAALETSLNGSPATL